MSLISALNVAVSSVNAINSAVRTVSDNVANANNENYNARNTKYQSLENGGVAITDIERLVNNGLFQDLTTAIAESSGYGAQDDVYNRLSNLLGISASQTPLADEVEDLSAAWKAFEASPESAAAQSQVLNAAQNITQEMERLSDGLDQIEQEIQTDVERSVTDLNDILSEIDRLNDDIVAGKSKGLPTSTEENLRDEKLQALSQIMEIKTFEASDGHLVVLSKTGLTLTDLNASTFTYDSSTGALTKSGHSSTDLITDGLLPQGKLKSLTDFIRTDTTAESSSDGGFAVVQKLRNQLDEVAFMLMDDSVARTSGSVAIEDSATIGAAGNITIAVGGTAQVVAVGAAQTPATVLANLNALNNVSARFDGHGQLQILTEGDGMTVAVSTAALQTAIGYSASTTVAADDPETLSYAYNQENSSGSRDITGNTDLTLLAGVAAGDQFSVSVGGAAATTITIGASPYSTQDLLDDLNDVDGVRARLDDTGGLEISTTRGQLDIQEVTNNPLTAANSLDFTFVGGSAEVENSAQSGEQNLDLFEVETGTALASASRLNFRVNDTLTNGTAVLKKSAATGVVQSMNSTNRSIGGSGFSTSNKSYTSLVTDLFVDVTTRAERFGNLFSDSTSLQENLSVQLRNEVGVDIDTEMAALTVLQNSYAATARVIQTVDQMFTTLEQAVR